MDFKINKRYTMRADITSRTLEVSEAFGVSLDDEFTFIVFVQFNPRSRSGDVVYIIADSGVAKVRY
ncbi:hypothetical protein [Desulforamulus aquiferis]|uniref:Uncharacterized protein n=1 Tax=Desulforamulus aquiferis TaxID=1397668 RepID=A0AAW7ZCM6_9FIRM|nr:hypothetical protein [Desulforamulus aquiferis]MDO7787000.1 hypothetical protein [Desulforamulus aquiferis]